MSDFIKIGNQITPRPKIEGIQTNLENGKIYNVCMNEMTGDIYLEENGNFNMPTKIYETEEDNKFIDRVIKWHKQDHIKSTGVLLSGEKGTGKTITMKRIAKKSGLPIIVVHPNIALKRSLKIFNKFKQDVIIMFDEIEKDDYYWPTKDLLGFLDGVEETCKKLVIMTCNDLYELNINLTDRCSRVRYLRKYTFDSNRKVIPLIVKDKISDETKQKELIEFLENRIEILSFDNIQAIVNEVAYFGDELTFEEIATDMNITLKNV